MAARFKFCLYVAGEGPHSIQAVNNLRQICDEFLSDRHDLEIIDVLKDQQRALTDGVMLTPLLVKLSPAPGRKIVGTLSQRESVLQVLGLSTQA